MNKHLALTVALAAFIPLAACQRPSSDDAQIIVAFEDYEDYEDWKKERAEDAINEPFKPAILQVSGTGKVKATPDVAVITGTIKIKANAEFKAVDKTATVTRAMQDAIDGKDIRLSFTRVDSSEERDPICLRHNNEARARHNQIVQDNYYNKRLLRDKNTKLKPRPAKARIAQKDCPVTHIDAYVGFTAWVRPTAMAGDILNDFTDAGVTTVNLYGYDFSDYDALYKEAGSKAVENAKAKAKMVAKTAGTKLTTLEQFSVDPPKRTSRYGPQAMIISNHGNRFVAAGQYSSTQDKVLSPGFSQFSYDGMKQALSAKRSSRNSDEVVVSGVRLNSKPKDRFNSIRSENLGRPTGETAAQALRRVTGARFTEDTLFNPNQPTYAGNANNALKMTLLAGPQTVTVNASLGYLYETPLNGVIITEPED